MNTLQNSQAVQNAIKSIFEIQQSLYIRDEGTLTPIGIKPPTMEQMSDLFGLLYGAQENIRSVVKSLESLY